MTDAEIERLKAEVIRLRDDNAALESQLADAGQQIERLETKYGDLSDFEMIQSLVWQLRDLTQPDGGPLRRVLPSSDASKRTLLALFDAAGVAP